MKIKLKDISKHDSTAFVSRAFYLAWQACGGPLGMGVFQNRPQSTEQDVFNNIACNGDYCFGSKETAERNLEKFRKANSVRADYVFGRMMKMTLGVNGDDIVTSDSDDFSDTSYHSFGSKYPNIKDLFKATADSLGVSYEIV